MRFATDKKITLNTGILKIRDAKGKHTEIPVKFAVVITETNWLSIFEGINTNFESGEKLRIIHHESKPSEYTVVHVCQSGQTFSNLDIWGVGILPEKELTMPFSQSDFWSCDLGLEFFHWPDQKILPKTINLKRGREYTLLESTNPNRSTNSYSRVVTWIDKETGGILEAEALRCERQTAQGFCAEIVQESGRAMAASRNGNPQCPDRFAHTAGV